MSQRAKVEEPENTCTKMKYIHEAPAPATYGVTIAMRPRSGRFRRRKVLQTARIGRTFGYCRKAKRKDIRKRTEKTLFDIRLALNRENVWVFCRGQETCQSRKREWLATRNLPGIIEITLTSYTNCSPFTTNRKIDDMIVRTFSNIFSSTLSALATFTATESPFHCPFSTTPKLPSPTTVSTVSSFILALGVRSRSCGSAGGLCEAAVASSSNTGPYCFCDAKTFYATHFVLLNKKFGLWHKYLLGTNVFPNVLVWV